MTEHTFEVTVAFKLTVDDEAALREIGHAAMKQLAEEHGLANGGFVETPLQAADYVSQDLKMSVSLFTKLVFEYGLPRLPRSLVVSNLRIRPEELS